jgi:hypothetical protein
VIGVLGPATPDMLRVSDEDRVPFGPSVARDRLVFRSVLSSTRRSRALCLLWVREQLENRASSQLTLGALPVGVLRFVAEAVLCPGTRTLGDSPNHLYHSEFRAHAEA